MKVYVVEICDRQLTRGRYPLAVCASEASARQVAERHFFQEPHHSAHWARPPHRGDIVAVLQATYARDYEIWAMTLVEDIAAC